MIYLHNTQFQKIQIHYYCRNTQLKRTTFFLAKESYIIPYSTMSLHETQNLETILSLTGPTGPNDKTCESILDQRTLFCMLIVLASCVIDATRSKQVVIPRKKKIVLAHVKKKNSQAVRLKHATASAFAESLPSMPQLLLPQHPCNGTQNTSSS